MTLPGDDTCMDENPRWGFRTGQGGIVRFRHGHELASHWWGGMFLGGRDMPGDGRTLGRRMRGMEDKLREMERILGKCSFVPR